MNEQGEVIRSKLDRPLALTGMMGAGKSFIGRALADKLRLPFYDSDREIEERAEKPVPRIFEEEGEAGFRAREKEVLLDLLKPDPCVIATGGGCVTTPSLLEALENQSLMIWLKAPASDLYERIKDDPGRPLLQTPDPQVRLESLLSEREPLYARAGIHIETAGRLNRDQVVRDLIKALSDHLNDARLSGS